MADGKVAKKQSHVSENTLLATLLPMYFIVPASSTVASAKMKRIMIN